jgi:16S rRNA (guanine(527)-N(7))-methyltransferase RsmG
VAYLQLLESELHTFEIDLPRPQVLALAEYCSEIDQWNQKVNLTALTQAALVRRLIAEPVWIARQLGMRGSLLDVGSGNGSPAVPFHIFHPFQSCHLVEARAKRAAFLRHLVRALNLRNVVVHRGRFEDVCHTVPTADWISLQAVALTTRLANSLRRVASPTTTIVWITSGNTQTDLNPVKSVAVPFTGTQVFLFQLDLS